jgi:dTDP-4-amino-4,6-dideoxygalactose transaminase
MGSRQNASGAVAPSPSIPFLDLQAQFAGIRAEVLAAIERVLDSQHFILGPEVDALEKEMARLAECQYAIGCASGSDALLLALMALGVGPQDEVITSPFTFVATAGAIARLGARPVFVDIKTDDYNIDPQQIAKAITSRTRAIIPVHLFGLSADMDPILEVASAHKLAVIEDAAQAIGARYRGKAIGGMGVAGCFSFFPSKNLGGAGDGGMITTNDPELADRLRILRAHGSRTKYKHELVGINSRLDALQAAILRVKLPRLDGWTAARERNADRYRSLFDQFGLTTIVKLPATFPDRKHVYNQFVIRTTRRDELREFLRSQAIPTEIYYPHPLHLQPAFAYLGYREGNFSNAESAANQVLALPIYSELSYEQQRRVVAAFAMFFKTENSLVPVEKGAGSEC